MTPFASGALDDWVTRVSSVPWYIRVSWIATDTSGDLEALNSHNCKGMHQDQWLVMVKTPFKNTEWKKLRHQQDVDYVSYNHYHRVGTWFHLSIAECIRMNPAKKNVTSADKNPQVFNDYLTKELQAGNILNAIPNVISSESPHQ